MNGDRERRALPKPPRPDLCRRFARKELAAGLPAILECFIEEAIKGSIPHAKALMSFAGLDRPEPSEPLKPKRKKGASVSDLLLRELRRGSSVESTDGTEAGPLGGGVCNRAGS